MPLTQILRTKETLMAAIIVDANLADAARGTAVQPSSVFARWSLVLLAVAFLGLTLILPLVIVFVSAFDKGWQTAVAAWTHPDARAAIRLTDLAYIRTVNIQNPFAL